MSNTNIKLAKETLTGDIRNYLIERYRMLPKPWEQMTESEQEDLVETAEKAAHHLVNQAINIIVSDGFKSIYAELDKVVVKDGIQAILKASKDSEYRHDLMDAQGASVRIIIVDTEEFEGESSPVKIDKNEPEFDLPDTKNEFDNIENIMDEAA